MQPTSHRHSPAVSPRVSASGGLNLVPVGQSTTRPVQPSQRPQRPSQPSPAQPSALVEIPTPGVPAVQSTPTDEWVEVTEADLTLASPVVTPVEVPTRVTTPVSVESVQSAQEDDEWGSVNDSDTNLIALNSPASAPSAEEVVEHQVPVAVSRIVVEDEDDDWNSINTDESVIFTPGASVPATSQPEPVQPQPVRRAQPPVDLELARKRMQPRKRRNDYGVSITFADEVLLKALTRLRMGSVQHLIQMLSASGYGDAPEASDEYISLKAEHVRRRLHRLEKGGYVRSRYMSGGQRMLPKAYAVTQRGLEAGDPDLVDVMPLLALDTSRAQTSMAHTLIAASYMAGTDLNRYQFVPDVVIQRAVGRAMKEGRYRPMYTEEMDAWREAEHLAVLIDGTDTPRVPDLVALERIEGGTGYYANDGWQLVQAVEVETSPKSVHEYVRILNGYRSAKIEVQFLIHNTRAAGSSSIEGIATIERALTRAAQQVWGVEDVDSIEGFLMQVVPDGWKSTQPGGQGWGEE